MKRIKLVLLTILSLLLLPNIAYAASGSISVSGASNIVEGSRVQINVTLSSNTAIGSWQMDLNYDKAFLQLISSSAEAGGTRMASYAANGTRSKTYTFAFRALKTGNTRVSVSSYLAYAFNDLSEMKLTSSSKTIKIMTQKELEATYSKDNTLKSLTVEGYELDKEFDKNTLDYTVNVPTGTTSVKINATVNDSNATVNGAGELEVTEGTNVASIVVTAQNGDQKTYNLTINVEDQNPINVKINNKDYVVVKNATLLSTPATFTETKITIEEFEIPAFINNTANITLVGLKDETGDIIYVEYNDGKYSVYNELNLKTYLLVPAPFKEDLDLIKTTVTINNLKYDAYKYSENSNYVIISAKSLENGKIANYLYDTENKTATLYDDTYIKESKDTITNYTYIIIAFAIGLLLSVIVIISLMHSLRKKQKKMSKFIEKQEAKIEATRKLNDVVSEVKKITDAEKKHTIKQDTTELKALNKKDKNKKNKEIKVTEVKIAETPKENIPEEKISQTKEIKTSEIKKENEKNQKENITEKTKKEKNLEETEVYNIFEDDFKFSKKKKKKF